MCCSYDRHASLEGRGGSADSRSLHHFGVLVHGIHKLRKPCRDACTRDYRHLRRHTSGRRPGVCVGLACGGYRGNSLFCVAVRVTAPMYAVSIAAPADWQGSTRDASRGLCHAHIRRINHPISVSQAVSPPMSPTLLCVSGIGLGHSFLSKNAQKAPPVPDFLQAYAGGVRRVALSHVEDGAKGRWSFAVTCTPLGFGSHAVCRMDLGTAGHVSY
jgi:hypothetical protein